MVVFDSAVVRRGLAVLSRRNLLENNDVVNKERSFFKRGSHTDCSAHTQRAQRAQHFTWEEVDVQFTPKAHDSHPVASDGEPAVLIKFIRVLSTFPSQGKSSVIQCCLVHVMTTTPVYEIYGRPEPGGITDDR